MKNYKTILADPPWKYGKGWGWGAGEYYKLMTVQDICSLCVPSDNNAHLYLWCPNGMIGPALDVMKAWGFIQKTIITWCKPNSIFGYYFKGQTEQLLFGIKGKLPPNSRKETTRLNAPNGKHSQKPDETYNKIEAVSPGPYLELFARNKREGWDVWGNEVKSDIELMETENETV